MFIAGGTESMSLIPMTGYKLSPSYKANMENLNYHVSMGATAEAVAAKYNISREALQQTFCLVYSHQNKYHEYPGALHRGSYMSYLHLY